MVRFMYGNASISHGLENKVTRVGDVTTAPAEFHVIIWKT
jgi:hypothetical protein